MVEALRSVLGSSDVRELGFVWYQPEMLPVQAALIIGQRASARLDVIPSATVTVGDTDIRVIVVRLRDERNTVDATSAGDEVAAFSSSLGRGGVGTSAKEVVRRDEGTLRRHPVQAILWPRALPASSLDAAQHLFPEVMTASGIVGARGLVLRSDGRFPFIPLTTRIPLLGQQRPRVIHVLGAPVRSFIEQIDFPFHRDLVDALKPSLPATADLLIDSGGVGIRFLDPVVAPHRDAIRSLAARIWPSLRSATLDGLHADVQVADPMDFDVVPTGPNRWELRTRGANDPVTHAERSGEYLLLSTEQEVMDTMLRKGEEHINIPSSCLVGNPSILAIFSLYPQVNAILGVDLSASRYAICGVLGG